MNKKINISNDIWSLNFLEAIKLSPHYKTALMWNTNINCRLQDTPYYKWLKSILEKEGSVWGGIIKTNQGLIKQCIKFKRMYIIAPYWKNSEEKIRCVIENNKTYYFGNYPCKIKNDGNLELCDGRHRLSILLAKGLSLPQLILCERKSEWEDIYNIALELHPNKHLYQPILHPDFQDWNQGRLEEKDKSIKQFCIDKNIKSAIDLGCCHGFTLYYLRDVLQKGIGVEYNEKRALISCKILSSVGMSCINQDMKDYLNSITKPVDCIFALAVFHHLLKQNTVDVFNKVLTKISNYTKYLIYELPSKTEQRFLWMPEEIRDNIDSYIMNKLNFNKIEEFDFNGRKIIILERKS